ncbi:hypothetical protein DFA_00658 [Cavenderia fasciculata]|uniref:Anaphase-promoting complex subunit 13 n=1 Tax=Cavenderia fasciculata TaxID=261658 RepID=F4PT04_CACFS|nr:uncharacterized protein DFA_00658 [Cavenderia fasciculata]EGG20793.1 hypothetical protein DFA_00658 [Cavenderia fasciculata]|eukprot:XP_004358643.1 hypothetical protein DFA_00658 [Cavenderia fasciculata]
MSTDSKFTFYLHSHRPLIDVIDLQWSQDKLPNESIGQSLSIDTLVSISDEFDELLKNRPERNWGELGLNDLS